MRRLKTVRRPPIYPKTPGHLPCSSLTHPLPLPSPRPSVSFGGFGVRLPLPNDAVMRTTALSGEVQLDGRPSVIEIDLQQLSSDQEFRDRYVRTRMFGEHPIGIFTVPNLESIPDGLVSREEVSGRVTGSLDIRGNTYPLEFDVEARDDGEVMYVVGRTTVTWQQLDIPVPTARSVASVENEIRVEVLLALKPASQ